MVISSVTLISIGIYLKYDEKQQKYIMSNLEEFKINDTPEEIKEFFPESFLNITQINYYDAECLIIDNETCSTGFYDGEINIAIDRNKDFVRFSLLHEIGHVLFGEISRDEQDRYRQMYRENESITNYGKERYDEDFAELYAYTNYPKTFKTNNHWVRYIDEKKWMFMQTLLNKYKQFDGRNLTRR